MKNIEMFGKEIDVVLSDEDKFENFARVLHMNDLLKISPLIKQKKFRGRIKQKYIKRQKNIIMNSKVTHTLGR